MLYICNILLCNICWDSFLLSMECIDVTCRSLHAYKGGSMCADYIYIHVCVFQQSIVNKVYLNCCFYLKLTSNTLNCHSGCNVLQHSHQPTSPQLILHKWFITTTILYSSIPPFDVSFGKLLYHTTWPILCNSHKKWLCPHCLQQLPTPDINQ